MAEIQKKLQELSDEFQKLQGELSTVVEAREKLEAQQQENTTVKKVRSGCRTEFDLLADDANIYKQIGPVLLKQDKTEAVMAVNGRLEFIEKEIGRIEKQIKDIRDKSEKVKIEIIRIQTAAQQAQAAA
ncbi:Prefoldin beta-like protein [Westerdykella ornata]|uniref:Prefoldin beta-like protein n=1 Tax=Westerdykella ornata TaxID=318751 RepID=A0A6A6JTU8_WESOR|nr:Prefoldin beta-like protein [Westerdykella ornata]KAF2278439.1 Prefoldin beta-like protein [Westerdykella ornata]